MDYTELVAEFINMLKEFYILDPSVAFVEFTQGELKTLVYFITTGRENVLPTELSVELSLSTARVANTLNSLEKKGYITRSMSPQDRRKILVNITPSGREHVEQKRAEVHQKFTYLFLGMGNQDAKDFVRLISRAIEVDKFRKNNTVQEMNESE